MRIAFLTTEFITAPGSYDGGLSNYLYKVLSEKHVEIFSGNDRPVEEIESALDQIIKWFENNERYEECHRLKQIKEQCLELK